MIVPQTRREAIDLYNERAKSKKKKTKYDMFLGGLICCSNGEFERHTRYRRMIRCTMCEYYYNGRCDAFRDCTEAADITLSKPWNGGAVG